MRKSKMKFIPELSLDVNDTGARYMIARHRYVIAEKFGITGPEWTANYSVKVKQEQLLKMLKADNPEKYNKLFDTVVRGIESAPEVVERSEELPADVLQKVNSVIEAYKDDAINSATNLVATSANEQYGKLMEHVASKAIDMIATESKKFNKVEYVVKSAGKSNKKIKGPVPECFQDILDLASQRMNILLVGPSGCGKTHVSKMVADSLGLDFSGQSCSAGMSESIFSGWLLPIKANGTFTYVQSEFVRIYENGGVFLFDEIDASDSNLLLFLNQALANGEFHLPQRHEKPHVKRHKDFVAIAAANTFGSGATVMYSGRNILDGATMDRFRMGIVPMDYDSAVEEKLIDAKILTWGRMFRQLIESRNLRKIMSTRLLIDATAMRKHGWSLQKIHDAYVADWSREDRRLIEASNIPQLIDSVDNPRVVIEEDEPKPAEEKEDGPHLVAILNAFVYKDHLKKLGAKWRPERKAWVASNNSPAVEFMKRQNDSAIEIVRLSELKARA